MRPKEAGDGIRARAKRDGCEVGRGGADAGVEVESFALHLVVF